VKNSAVLLFALSLLSFQATAQTTIPKKTFKLFILAGQSNAAGCGNGEELKGDEATTSGRVLQYIVPIEQEGRTSVWAPMAPYPRVDERMGIKKCAFGPELLFSKTVAKAMPDDIIGVVKQARGGTSIIFWDKDWKQPDWGKEMTEALGRKTKGERVLYDDLIKNVKYAVGLAQKMPEVGKVEICAVLWVQTERDCTRGEKVANEYKGNMLRLIHNVRTDLGVPDLPFLFMDAHSGAAQGIVKAGLREVEKTVPNTKLVTVDGIPIQGVHFRTAGQIELGTRFAKAWLEMTRR